MVIKLKNAMVLNTFKLSKRKAEQINISILELV